MYELLLLIGGLGFLAMAILGAAGGGHHGSGASHGHALHGAHLHELSGAGKFAKGRGASLFSLISPMDLFALALGAGAAGILLRALIAPGLLIWGALGGALVADFLILKPIFALAMRFVSKPSDGLEGAVSVTAFATTKFDTEGKGLVQLSLDGQLVQLLARLSPAERELGENVYKGDEVTVLAVDGKRNTCTVSKLTGSKLSRRNPQ